MSNAAVQVWLIFFGIFVAFTIPMLIGQASVNFVGADDVNSTLGFQVDLISSGSGFIGLLRTTKDFFTEFFPKMILFNYDFLHGELEVVKRIMQIIVGGAFSVAVGLTLVGIIQRTF